MWRVPLVATAAAVPLYVLWAGGLATGGGDLAAQLAWTGFTEQHPSSAYNLSWYGGMHTANYSVLAPPLMAAFGVRAVSVAAGLLATWALARLVVRSGVTRPLWPAIAGTGVLWANIASGRTTFALGVAIALLALLYARRPVLAGGCAALATLASPVAGLFLVVAGAAYLLDRRWRPAVALVVPPALVVATTTVLFPFEGEMPMQTEKLWLPLVVSAAVALTAPRAWRLVRYGALVYGLGVVLTYLIPSPIGRNVERLAGLAGPPVLLAAVVTAVSAAGGVAAFLRAGSGTGPRPTGAGSTEAGSSGAGAPTAPAGRGGRARTLALRFALVAALAVNTNWLIDKTEDDLAVSNTVPPWAANTDGVVRELNRLGADRTRVEVVPARNHREAAVLAPHINMARGWNRQLDVERGRLFYDGSLSPRTYRAWLDHWAVGYVVLHHGRPDGPALDEAAIVRSEPPWLERVWRDDGWTVYRVRDAVPLVSSPATVVRADAAELVVRMPAAGSVTVRVAHSPWLRADGACLRPDGEWTRLTVDRPGDYTLASPYRFPRAGC
ncbi:glycosyltransferase family 87 protein [Streptomyces sp. NPDC051018]|uniref:glycosyltransferase family 87 protein n=1 Tax=Streptomyces sp. NPDC051018 TaxID=3365639 RepID=UPI003798B07F